MASPTIIERSKYLETGHKTAQRTISQIKGATATHLASGISLPVLDDVVETGSAAIGFSQKDDIKAIKKLASGKISLLGNLNGIDMVNWDKEKTGKEVKKLIREAAVGWGVVLSSLTITAISPGRYRKTLYWKFLKR